MSPDTPADTVARLTGMLRDREIRHREKLRDREIRHREKLRQLEEEIRQLTSPNTTAAESRQKGEA